MISIVTVCKNDVSALRSTRESVIGQNISGLEHVIVVAPSEDGTCEYALSQASTNTKVHVLPAQGIFNAMNYGLEQAEKEWILFLNAGDVFVKGSALREALEFISSRVVDAQSVLFGGIVENSGSFKSIFPKGNTTPRRYLYGRLRVIHPSFMARRELFNSVGGFSEKYRIASDYLLIARALSFPAVTSNQPLSIFRTGGVSTLNVIQSLAEAHEIRVNEGLVTRFEGKIDLVWYSYQVVRHRARKLISLLTRSVERTA